MIPTFSKGLTSNFLPTGSLCFSESSPTLNPPKKYRLITVPKTGTHFLKEILKELGCKKADQKHHIFYDKPLAFRRLDPKIGYIASIRDPRDTLISLVHYVDKMFTLTLQGKNNNQGSYLSKDKSVARRWVKKLSFDQKLMHLINLNNNLGVDFKWVAYKQMSEADRLMKIDPLPDNIIMIRFEDLVGKRGGGSEIAQRRVIKQIARHVNVPVTEEKVTAIVDATWGRSGTFRKGTINQWKEVYTEEHIKAFKARWNHFLLDFGYETDPNWDEAHLKSLEKVAEESPSDSLPVDESLAQIETHLADLQPA